MARYRNRRRKSSFPKFLFFAIFAFMIINMFESKQVSKPSTKHGSNTGTIPVRGTDNQAEINSGLVTSYALQPLTNNWPDADGTETVVSSPSEYLTKNYYVILDASGSMRKPECTDGKTKMEVAISALAEFSQALPASSNFGLALFHEGLIEELIPLGKGDRSAVQQLLNNVKPEGSTPLRSSIDFAFNKITEQAKNQLGYGEYHLVVLTDGKASDGQNPRRVVNAILGKSPVNLQTIGFCIGLDHILNQPGRSQYRAADNVEQLRSGLKEVLAESPDFDVSSF